MKAFLIVPALAMFFAAAQAQDGAPMKADGAMQGGAMKSDSGMKSGAMTSGTTGAMKPAKKPKHAMKAGMTSGAMKSDSGMKSDAMKSGAMSTAH